MGEWHEFARLRRFNLTYRTLLLGTFTLTVVADLTVAVEVGLVTSCVFFVWRMGQLFTLSRLDGDLAPGVVAYALDGALFFGAVGKLEPLAEQLPAGTRTLASRPCATCAARCASATSRWCSPRPMPSPWTCCAAAAWPRSSGRRAWSPRSPN
jgi:MFS superfamily sulfate permease-like transporter